MAEKYIKTKHGGWPEHAAAMVTASLTVGQYHMNNFSSYTIVRVAPRSQHSSAVYPAFLSEAVMKRESLEFLEPSIYV